MNDSAPSGMSEGHLFVLFAEKSPSGKRLSLKGQIAVTFTPSIALATVAIFENASLSSDAT